MRQQDNFSTENATQHPAASLSPLDQFRLIESYEEAKGTLEERALELKEIERLIKRETLRKRCKEDLYFFITEVLGFRDLYEPLHRPLCEQVSDQTKLRQMILIPRGHFKTTIISVCYPLWLLINNPKKRIALCSVDEERAEENLEELVQRASLPEFLELFQEDIGAPEEWPRRTSSRIRVKKRGGKTGASISVYGVGSSEVGRHFDHMLIDDMVGQKQVATQEMREKIWQWFSRQFSVLDPNCQMVVLGTRWHHDDPYSRIKTLDGWEITERTVQENGAYIFPTRFNEDFMKEIRQTQDEYTVSCFYYNHPSGSELNPFDTRKFRFINYQREKIKDSIWTYVVVDPATTTKSYSCPSGILVVDALPGKRGRKGGRWVIVDAILRKMDPDTLVDLIFDLVRKEKPKAVVIEAEAQQATYAAWMRREMMHRNLYFRVEEVVNKRDRTKLDRLRALQPFMHRHHIMMSKAMSQKEDFLREFETFGHAKDDDLVVATSFIPLKVANPPAWRRKKKPEREVPVRSRLLQELIERPIFGRGRAPLISVRR